MLGEKGIIAFSPELGSCEMTDGDIFSKFYPSKELILEDINKDYPVVELFFEKHKAKISNPNVRYVKDFSTESKHL